jgi:hypothetical protein
VIVSADSDFGELLAAAHGATRPSVVLLRSADRLTSDQQAALLAANLPAVADDLEPGAVVTIVRGPDANPVTAHRSRWLTPRKQPPIGTAPGIWHRDLISAELRDQSAAAWGRRRPTPDYA